MIYKSYLLLAVSYRLSIRDVHVISQKMGKRIKIAFLISIIGTSILYILGKLLHGLVGTAWDLIACSIGAFLTTYLLATYVRNVFKANLVPSLAIVFMTFIFISLGHAGEQIFVRRVSVDGEAVNKFMWATIMTSWWLVPLVAYMLKLFNEKINE